VNYLHHFNGPGTRAEFKPYLMQVLSRNSKEPTLAIEDVRGALKKKKDDLLKNGLPRAAARWFDESVGFEYMGAAEYEFGAISNAIKYLVDNAKDLRYGSVTVKGKDIPKNWCRGNSNYDKRAEKLNKLRRHPQTHADEIAELEKAISAPPPDATFYYIAPAEYAPFVQGLVDDMAAGKQRNKNSNRFSHVADPIDEYDRSIGWLCCDYPLVLVKDAAAYERLSQLFKVKP
jgi:hypothetical protein